MNDVAAMYRSLAGYSDHGHVLVEAGGVHSREQITGLVDALSFETAYRRGTSFEFRVRRQVNERPSAMEVIASEDLISLSWAERGRKVESIAEALAAMAIPSFGASLAVTSLLMPDELGCGGLLLDSVVWLPFSNEAHAAAASAPHQTHVLFDSDTKMIRRIVKPLDPNDEGRHSLHGGACRRCLIEVFPVGEPRA